MKILKFLHENNLKKYIGTLPVDWFVDGFLRPVHTTVTDTPLFTAGQVFSHRPLTRTVMGVHVQNRDFSYNNFSLYGKVMYVQIPEQLLLNRPISYRRIILKMRYHFFECVTPFNTQNKHWSLTMPFVPFRSVCHSISRFLKV